MRRNVDSIDHSMIISLWNFTKSLSGSNKMLRNLVLLHIIWQDYCTICNISLRPCLWDDLMFTSIAYRKAKLICRSNEDHMDIKKKKHNCFSAYFFNKNF
jgi:hypothetical protein